MTYYVWQCNKCTATMTANYNATEADFNRFKKCGCKEDGQYEWKHNYDEEEMK